MTADLKTALELANSGFRVFPLEPNSKTPMLPGWPEKATTDRETIERWWTDQVMNWPAAWGVGIATGRGLVIIDLDVKHDGERALKSIAVMTSGLPPTLRVRTPSGGLHLYYRTATPVRTSAGKIAPGIDVRGEGGYVVGPGTEINGKAYAPE